MSVDVVNAVVVFEEKANQLKSFGVGAIALVVLLGALVALVVFGGGREHT